MENFQGSLFDACFYDLESQEPDIIEEEVWQRLNNMTDGEQALTLFSQWFAHEHTVNE